MFLALTRLMLTFINYLAARDDCASLQRMDLRYLKVRHPADRHFQKVIHLVLK